MTVNPIVIAVLAASSLFKGVQHTPTYHRCVDLNHTQEVVVKKLFVTIRCL